MDQAEMTMKLPAKRLLRNEEGAAAIEFALYSTAFLAMLFGGIYASILGYTSSSLHAAVESAARCRAMGTTCTDATTTQTFAAAKFHNLTGSTATFVSTTQACGNQVTASMNYDLKYIIGRRTVALSAAACFPVQSASAT
jgi:Flp pilus assembly protein TadG